MDVFLFFGPSGVVESGLPLPKLLPLQFSVFTWLWPHTGTAAAPLYALTLFSVAAFGLGRFTRVSGAMIWCLTASWINPLTVGFNASDYMVRIIAFVVMLGAVGGCFDRGKKRVEIWPLRLLQIQLVAIYFYSAVNKLAFADWREGTAFAHVLGDELFTRFDFTWLGHHPTLVGVATYGSLAFELALFPLLVWVGRLRPAVLLVGLVFHLVIALTMKVTGFFEVMVVFYLAFLTESDWSRVLRLARAAVKKKA